MACTVRVDMRYCGSGSDSGSDNGSDNGNSYGCDRGILAITWWLTYAAAACMCDPV